MWGYPEFYIPVPGGYGTSGPRGTPHVGRSGGRRRNGMVTQHGAPAAFQD